MASPPRTHVTRPRLVVGVVGSGRVGGALGRALDRAGHQLVASTPSSRADALLPGVPRLPADEVAARASLLLLTVPDDTLTDLVAGLAATGALRPGQLVVHTSGRYGLAPLEPAARAGALPLALHPAMTFTGGAADLPRLSGASFGVTSPPELRAAGETLALEMGGEPVWVPDAARPLYHAALAHGSNHLVTLVAQAMDLLRDAGVEEPARVLGPLLGAALDNVLRVGDAALTGPVVRGDAATVSAHVAALAGDPAEPAYRVLARASADRALAAGRLDPARAGALLAALADDRTSR
ncbi:MAG: Rossmann-like and DUF2520 domain-containing protein [Mycobacteriales bacterium]